MRTETDIANMACDFLTLDPIGNLATDQGSGRFLRRNYQESLETVLREFSWNCATTRRYLNRVAGLPEMWREYLTYNSVYDLPDDCLRVIGINDRPVEEIFWKVEAIEITDSLGNVLSTRQILRVEADFWRGDTIQLEYVKRVNAGAMDAHLAKAVALELAIRSANKARSSSELLDRLLLMYKQTTTGDGTRKGGQQIDSRSNHQLPARKYASTGARARAGIL